MSKADYDALTPELKYECKLILHKLERAGKKLGIPLENKNGKDLRGYYKLYFNQARYRIVYTIIDERIEITSVGETMKESLEIVGIGKRDKEFIYNIINQRINMMKDNLDD
jgi:mRNA-degrading endonuclease RelE of RelBE toxin-antitoxin system